MSTFLHRRYFRPTRRKLMTSLFIFSVSVILLFGRLSVEQYKKPLGDGGWSEWGGYSPCSTLCGRGYSTKYRKCNSPPPSYGAASCNGASNQTRKCLAIRCDDWWQDIKGLPMSYYKWPLVIDAHKVIREYKSGELKIPPITTDNSTIILFPSDIKCKEEIMLTVLIKTRVEDRHNRDVLRRTWVADLHSANLQHSFLLGQCKSNKCKKDLQSELDDHQDIVQGDFIDAYHNNTIKFRMGLKYIAYHCHTSRYVLIIDGDYSLNVKRLLEYLAELKYPKDLYAGTLWHDSRPFRVPGHAQYMSYQFYPFRRLPPFIAAGASLLSTEIVEPLYIIGQFTKYVEFDDVFYGMVAKKLGIPLVNATDVLPSYIVPKVEDTEVYRFIIGSHRFGNLTEVEIIHGYIHNYN